LILPDAFAICPQLGAFGVGCKRTRMFVSVFSVHVQSFVLIAIELG
jgi:hypothetical protein